MNEALKPMFDSIVAEGLKGEDFLEAISVLRRSLEKRGIENIDPDIAIHDLRALLSSDIDPVEKGNIMVELTALAAQFKFKMHSTARQYKDFESGKNKKVFYHPITGQEIGPFDKKTLELILRTRSMMLFPEPSHRTLREKLIKDPIRNLRFAPNEKIGNIALKRLQRTMIVGVTFKIQCEHWAAAQRRRSLNIVMAANEKGYFSEWKKADISVGLARKYMKDFASVRHLLAANLALTWIDKQENPQAHQAGAFGVAFFSFFVSPARFFLAADPQV